ncbi:ATP-binding protein [Tistrella bauzanensis]
MELGVRHHHGTDGAGGTIEIYVADTGIGIAAEDIQRVFQPFEQIDSSLSRRYEGTGLGMSLVKAMVDLHDGEVLLESQPSQGTTVRVLLPDSRLIPDAGADDDEADDIIERLQIIRRDNI